MPITILRRPTRPTKPQRGKPAVLAALAIAFLAGCGPFGYLKKVSKDANRAVADAKAAGAEQYAPYEYWGAVAYLDQAKVLMAYSEYERSFDYGVRAKQLAEEAKRKADMRETGSTRQTLEDPNAPDADPNAAPAQPAPAQPTTPAADSGASATGDAGSGSAGGSINVGGGVGGGK